MVTAKKNLRVCNQGHKFFKTSGCPTCPVCEKKAKPSIGFLSELAAPARRALENEGITKLQQLAKFSEKEIINLHGMGPSSLPKLRATLKAAGLCFKKDAQAKTTEISDQEQVSLHIQNLPPALGKIVETIRQIILATDKTIGERIKWNNPGFYYTGKMKPFDPKEYKRDIVVFNLYKGRIMLVFPGGAKLNDKSGFLTGDYKDGRRIAIFQDMNDVKSKEKLLQNLLKEWLKLVDK